MSEMESLYPFLYSDTADLSAVMAQVRESTVAKAAEILELRRTVCERDGARIAECARQAAARFGAGGRLFAFGNGGSATDAQQLATLFLNPGGDIRPLPAFGLANDTSVVTALCNDIGVEVVFARRLATATPNPSSPRKMLPTPATSIRPVISAPGGLSFGGRPAGGAPANRG